VSTLPVHDSSGLTWDEFLALPHELRNAALIDGEVVVNPPNARHEWIVQNLILVFHRWISAGRDRGEVSTQQPVKINDRRGYQPDFAWYPPERCAPPDQLPSFSGPPALVVEVFSPSSRGYDLLRKREDYERIGIPELWFVDPETKNFSMIACQRAAPDAPYKGIELSADDHLTSPLLDGFDLHVAELFRR
jgi:Uma2 family endonuclease